MPEDPEAVGGIGDAPPAEDAEGERVDPRPEAATAGRADDLAAGAASGIPGRSRRPAACERVERASTSSAGSCWSSPGQECQVRALALDRRTTSHRGWPPRRRRATSWRMTTAAPCARASSPVPSVEPSSTTIASNRGSRGNLSSTRPIFPASLSAGNDDGDDGLRLRGHTGTFSCAQCAINEETKGWLKTTYRLPSRSGSRSVGPSAR